MEKVRCSSRRATLLIAAGGLTGLLACADRVEAQALLQVDTVYAGEPERPILGIAFETTGPKVLIRGPAPSPPTSFVVVPVPTGTELSFDDGWTRHLRVRRDPTLPVPDLASDPARLPGGWGLALGARATLAWSTSAVGQPRALLRVGGADRELTLPESRLRWAEVSATGEPAAIGLLGSTAVFDRTGAESLRLPPAERARLSRGGQWLALEHVLEGRSTLALVRTSDGLTSHYVSEPLLALAFDAAGTRLAAITRGRVRLFALDGTVPAELGALPAPTGQEWRSAAFAPDGTLAMGGIRDVRRARRQGRDPARPPVTAAARIVVEVRGPTLATVVGEARIDVGEWSSLSPELAFAPDGRLFAIVRPSGFEVVLP